MSKKVKKNIKHVIICILISMWINLFVVYEMKYNGNMFFALVTMIVFSLLQPVHELIKIAGWRLMGMKKENTYMKCTGVFPLFSDAHFKGKIRGNQYIFGLVLAEMFSIVLPSLPALFFHNTKNMVGMLCSYLFLYGVLFYFWDFVFEIRTTDDSFTEDEISWTPLFKNNEKMKNKSQE